MIAVFDFAPLAVNQFGDGPEPPPGPTVYVPALPLRVVVTPPTLKVALRRVS